jgi:large subunit ribosomal protein L28e
MKIPSEVVWQLTKKYNSFLVKANGQQLTRDPLNLTGLHNASQSGLANSGAIGLSAVKAKGKKGTKSVVTLLQKHKTHNKIAKRKNNSQSGSLVSTITLKRGINRIGKVVKGLSNISERTRKQALRRLARLHVATRPQVKGAAAKKEEKK